MNTIEIPLTQGRIAIIDDMDWELVRGYKWHAEKNDGTFYAKSAHTPTPNCQKAIFLHRLIMQPATELIVDHIDGNGLNNCRNNLRVVTRHQNAINRKISTNNTSGYKCVHLCKKSNKWIASIGAANCKIRIGCFYSAFEAALAYDAVAKEWYGQYARLNFP